MKTKVDSFWFTYFCIRLFYLFFTVFVYSKLTILGDTHRYLTIGISPSVDMLFSSTLLMDFLGGIAGYLSGGIDIISNFPFMLVSFFSVKWVVESLELKKYVSKRLLLFLLSTPSFCIWTSICSKETIGLLFISIFAVLLVNFLQGDYKIRVRDWGAAYLCLLFKPQYFIFILQGLFYIYLSAKIKRPQINFLLGVVFVFCNLLVLYLLRNIVNEYAEIMYMHFDFKGSGSTRDNIFLHENDFFYHAPAGMFLAFWGPNLSEMLSKPTHLFVGIESFVVMVVFCYLVYRYFFRLLIKGKFSPTILFSYFIIFTGISLLHYPFGIFNPGSAIRYRTNFFFLFVVLLLYLHIYTSHCLHKKNNL
ncbi:hypothetical protein LJC44_01210 [Parabacteroides sp. OttesenSCG-928-G06]|nr:hypothetical protein [Parabacteroides sp. OttesenSCG-928-G06]